MSAISLDGYSCVWPCRSTAFLRRLAKLLAMDEARRRPPAITLAGPQLSPSKPPPPPKPPAALLTSTGRLRWAPYRYDDTPEHRAPFEPGDERWTYTRAKLLQMNARFVERLERAFARGKESRAAAAASITEKPCPRPPGGFNSLGHGADLRAT